MSRSVSLTVAAALILGLSACGNDEPDPAASSDQQTPARHKGAVRALVSYTDATVGTISDQELQAYQPSRELYLKWFRYHSNAASDLEAGDDRLFAAGVSACRLLGEQNGILEIIAGTQLVLGTTYDGAEAVMAAATESLCPNVGVRFPSRTSKEATRMAELLTAAIPGAVINKESAEVNAKAICLYLEQHTDAQGLYNYVASSAVPFIVDRVAGEKELKELVRASTKARCFPYYDRLGPWWWPPAAPAF